LDRLGRATGCRSQKARYKPFLLPRFLCVIPMGNRFDRQNPSADRIASKDATQAHSKSDSRNAESCREKQALACYSGSGSAEFLGRDTRLIEVEVGVVLVGKQRKNYRVFRSTPVRESVQGQGWVTWATTIAIFLAIVATFIVVFLLRYALRRTPRRRLEPRTSTRVRLELSSLDGPSIHEITFTKNVSHHGACALSKNRWVPNNTVQVRFADRAASSRARIAYCNPFHDVFVIGLQFSTAIHC
jgi:hypothetical protein